MDDRAAGTLRIERVSVRATLDEPEAALARADAEARAGDDSWQQWVREYHRGEAMIVRLEVTLESHDGQPRTIEISNHGIFIETDLHPPKVEQQIADLVSKDFPAISRELSEWGHRLDQDELGEMYVHVDLGEDLRSALKRLHQQARPQSTDGPRADIRVSKTARP